MTITQLQIILKTARTGSISAAARELGIPQPNASSGIRAVEKEVGFEIFKRDSGGISLTDKGQLFLEHAQRIIDETDIIHNLNEYGRICQLRVGNTNYYRGRNAFVRFCANHTGEGIADLQFYNVAIEDGIRLLSKHMLDIVVGTGIDSLLPTISESAKKMRLDCMVLGDDYPVITLRKDHPIIQEMYNGQKAKEEFDLSLLEKYPYVAYHSLNADFEAPYVKAAFQAPGKYYIYIEEKETRFKLVQQTDAFMIGVKQPQEVLDQYNLVEYEYPHINLKMICLLRSIDRERSEIKEYIDLLMHP